MMPSVATVIRGSTLKPVPALNNLMPTFSALRPIYTALRRTVEQAADRFLRSKRAQSFLMRSTRLRK